MTTEQRARIRAWRALPESEKVRRRQAMVVDQVVASMAMEGEPVSDEWVEQARARQELVLAAG